jgi:hypothetical protein
MRSYAGVTLTKSAGCKSRLSLDLGVEKVSRLGASSGRKSLIRGAGMVAQRLQQK